MKKLIYTTIVLAIAAIGCTKSNIVDVPEAQKTPITFDTYNGKIPVTKATEITKDNISEIQVYGFHAPANGTASYTSTYMDPAVGREYNETTKTWGPWEYNPLSYWPASGTLEFVAHGVNTPRFVATDERTSPLPGELAPISGSYVEFTYTVPTAASAQKDLIAAHVSPTAATTTVSLNMKHLLSRVGFKLKTQGEGTTVTINNVTLHGTFSTMADIDLTNAGNENDPFLTVAAESSTVSSYSLFTANQSFITSSADTDAVETVTGTTSYTIYDLYATTGTEATNYTNRYMMIIPEEIGTITNGLADEYDIDNDGEKTETIIPYVEVEYSLGAVPQNPAKLPLLRDMREAGAENPKWEIWEFEGGKAYEFIFEVSISEIKFTGNVQPWDEDLNGDKEANDDIDIN